MVTIPARTGAVKEQHAFFLALEGTDGSGISTQTGLLVQQLRSDNIPVYATKQPSDGPVGAMIRLSLVKRLAEKPEASLSEKSQAEILALWFAADRIDHFHNTVMPKLSQGVSVVCDRYDLSSFAYQGLAVADDAWLESLNAKVRRPDLTLFLDVDPKTCLDRLGRRELGGLQLFETLETLKRVHEAYQQTIQRLVARGEKIVSVDGSQTVDQIHAEILKHVRTLPGMSHGQGPGPGITP